VKQLLDLERGLLQQTVFKYMSGLGSLREPGTQDKKEVLNWPIIRSNKVSKSIMGIYYAIFMIILINT
jgi:hypothetical protein